MESQDALQYARTHVLPHIRSLDCMVITYALFDYVYGTEHVKMPLSVQLTSDARAYVAMLQSQMRGLRVIAIRSAPLDIEDEGDVRTADAGHLVLYAFSLPPSMFETYIELLERHNSHHDDAQVS
jgi:hypothetical protein